MAGVAATRERTHPWGAAREVILRCAREAFARDGFHDANIKDIAAAAQVSESLLYRYFGSKSGLFEESVVLPGRAFVQTVLAEWAQTSTTLTLDAAIRRFVELLIGFARENEGQLLAWAAANRSGRTEFAADDLHGQGVRRIASFVAAEAERRGLEHPDLEMAVACAIGMVLSMALLDDVLFPRGSDHPDDERMVTEITRFIKGGILHP